MQQHIKPRLADICAVDRDILGITIQAGRITREPQVPYVPEARDEIEEIIDPVSNEPCVVKLIRGGRLIGFLVGKDRRLLAPVERLEGRPFDEALAGKAISYRITSPEDERYTEARQPLTVWRKTKVSDWAQPRPDTDEAARRHWLYLKLPFPMREGFAYRVDLTALALANPEAEFVHDPLHRRSEAVHAGHIGFRPDDPGKTAFLSLWLGTGGAHRYPPDLRFRIVDDATDETVYTDGIGDVWPVERPEQMPRAANYNLTDVARMDFSTLQRPGRYRVVVDGIGCSAPFVIGRDAWTAPFRISMRGCLMHRSGIALKPPVSDYRRPRCFHPDDGVKVYHSECPLMYSGNGLNALGTDTDNFGNLIAGRTDEIVPDAWGSYMDAGDWDRRIQHLDATRLHLELAELFPAFVAGRSLNLPESGNGLPDVINEALFNLDGYRRLQAPEGGIRGGIESAQHPAGGECSWQESQTIMAYKPGLWSSHVYAGVAARAARALQPINAHRAAVYAQSALRAMQWAEAEYADWPRRPEYPKVRASARQRIDDDRALAALELYGLTRDARWHELFKQTMPPDSRQTERSMRRRDAAFLYARLDPELADASLQQAARDHCIELADRSIRFQRGNAWLLASPDENPVPKLGFYTVPGAIELIRGHVLTGDEQYLRAAVQAALFGAGANPMNLCMTTGVGHDYPRNPMHLDSRRSGQPPPEGITVYGSFDFLSLMDKPYWGAPFRKSLDRDCTPPGSQWPPPEGYFDVFAWPPMCEYTIMQNLGPNAYCWGYLAARGSAEA